MIKLSTPELLAVWMRGIYGLVHSGSPTQRHIATVSHRNLPETTARYGTDMKRCCNVGGAQAAAQYLKSSG